MRVRLPFVLAACLAAAPTAAASFGSAGTAGADFSKILVAPRPAAMGGAGAALGAELGGLDLNPAALAGLRGAQAEAAHVAWLEDIALDRVALGWGSRGGAALALAYVQLGTPDIQGFDAAGSATGAFRQQDRSLALAGAWPLGPVDLGLGVRGLQRQLAGLQQSGVDGDLGARLRLGAGWSLALSGLHFGSLAALEEEADAAPGVLRAGLGWEREMGEHAGASLALDGQQAVDGAPQLRAGAELRLYRVLALRAGSQVSRAYDGRQAFTAGAGFLWQGLSLDYAWAPFGALGSTHRFGLSWNGSPRRARRGVTARAAWLQAQREGEGAVLSWDSAGAPRWALYLKKGAGEELTRMGEFDAAAARVRLKRVAPNADVTFAVAPVDPELGEGPRSHQLVLRPGKGVRRALAPPLPPRRVRVTRDSGGLRLAWDPPQGESAGILYQAYASSRGDGGFKHLGGLDAGLERRVSLKGLPRRVFFSVRARLPVDDALESDWAETAWIEP